MVSVLAAAAALAVLRSGAPSTGWAAVLIAVALLLAGLRVADLPTLGLPGLVAGAAALAGSGYRGLGAAALAPVSTAWSGWSCRDLADQFSLAV